MSEFKSFAAAVAAAVASSPERVFSVTVPGDGLGDELWQHYLASFPEGSNPIFRVRTEHDGSYDRNFVRQLGGIVAVTADGRRLSIWDAVVTAGLPFPYNVVAEAMAEKVAYMAIKTLFTTRERMFGHKPNVDDTGIHFTHFMVNTPDKWLAQDDTRRGAWNTSFDVLRRTVDALVTQKGLDALSQVEDLIASNSIYRGTEFAPTIRKVRDLLAKVEQLEAYPKVVNYLWLNAMHPAAIFKNSSIGSLVFDLIDGVDLTEAVRMYETKVAPQNYRRTAAVVTPKMVQNAMGQIEQLGLRSALDRRHAVLGDLKVTNVLWVDRSASKKLSQDPLTDTLLKSTKKSAKAKGITEGKKLLLSEFIEQVLPNAEKVELLVPNSMKNSFMMMTAPENDDAPDLFRWAGSVGWTYAGNVTDALTQRVKAAGGVTDAALRFSLGWANGDDMDLHLRRAPGVAQAVYFGNRISSHARLDVDMNAGGITNSTDPVENIYLTKLIDGEYEVGVNRYSTRNQSSQGWTLQAVIENSVVRTVSSVTNQNATLVFKIQNGEVVRVTANHSDLTISEGVTTPGQFWGVNTEQFNEVSVVTLSPNHWEGETGNKHTFFILKDAKCPDNVRGIYNEFLKPELNEHRKVFDLIADKTMILANDNEQLAGVGISSTMAGEFTFRVQMDNRPHIFNVTNKE